MQTIAQGNRMKSRRITIVDQLFAIYVRPASGLLERRRSKP
jgi:hypothetical protein